MKCRSDAIVLRKVAYGDNDLIVTFFSQDHGKLKGFAKSARKSKRRFGSAMQLGAHLELHWSVSSKSNLARISEARALNHSSANHTLDSISQLIRILELVDLFLPDEEPSNEKFAFLKSALDGITSNRFDTANLIDFQLGWLTLCGFSPWLSSCSHCHRAISDSQEWYFSLSKSGFLCSMCKTEGLFQLSSKSARFLSDSVGDRSTLCSSELRDIDNLLTKKGGLNNGTN